MKKYSCSLVVLFFLMTVISCSSKHEVSKDEYTCPMHPAVKQNKPGNCPICGMTLVKRKISGKDKHSSNEQVKKNKSASLVHSLRVIQPTFSSAPETLRVNGTVERDPRNSAIVSARVAGRIERLFLRSDFQPVFKGEKILDLYSPELQTAQQELIYLLKGGQYDSELVGLATSKLKLLGVSKQQLDELIASRKAAPTIGIYSPVDGFMQPPSGNRISEGDYLEPGQEIATISSSKSVWVDLELSPDDFSGVALHDPVLIQSSAADTIKGYVDSLQPTLDNGFGVVRVYLSNAGNQFRPGMSVTGVLRKKRDPAIRIPQSSVIDLGKTKIVFVSKGGKFTKHIILGSASSDGWVNVTKGLTIKDSVVYNAGFMIDADELVEPQRAVSLKSNGDESTGSASAPAEALIAGGYITTQAVVNAGFSFSHSFPATLVLNEETAQFISSRVAGRVEKLFFKEKGQRIEYGQPVYSMYSEKLQDMEQEYVVGAQYARAVPGEASQLLLEAARNRLKAIGLSSRQIDALAEKKEKTTTFFSASAGVIEEIEAIEGQTVEQGALLYKINNPGTVWAEARLYPSEATSMRPGMSVQVNVDSQEKTIQGTIVRLEPEYLAGNQFVNLRILISNQDGKLLPGLRASVTVLQPDTKAIMVPANTVIHIGKNAQVWIQERNGEFTQRIVTTGFEAFGKVEITSGLTAGDRVAISGAFLLYAEDKLKNSGPG